MLLTRCDISLIIVCVEFHVLFIVVFICYFLVLSTGYTLLNERLYEGHGSSTKVRERGPTAGITLWKYMSYFVCVACLNYSKKDKKKYHSHFMMHGINDNLLY